MFNNLIESSSHAREFKRRGSFVLFTGTIYALLFVVAGVMSIYAYDARLSDPDVEITMLNPLDLPAAPVEVTHSSAPPRNNNNRPTQTVRQIAMASVNHPEIVPEHTSVTPNKNLPVPEHGTYIIGDHDEDAIAPPGTGRIDGTGGPGNSSGPAAVVISTPPPLPVHTPAPPRVVKSPQVLNGLAISLPKPAYPPIAKQARIQGSVNVQVLVDESGRVISAKAVSGSAMLMHAAQQAALGARFSPTKIGEQAVKVSGVITYNFILQ